MYATVSSRGFLLLVFFMPKSSFDEGTDIRLQCWFSRDVVSMAACLMDENTLLHMTCRF